MRRDGRPTCPEGWVADLRHARVPGLIRRPAPGARADVKRTSTTRQVTPGAQDRPTRPRGGPTGRSATGGSDGSTARGCGTRGASRATPTPLAGVRSGGARPRRLWLVLRDLLARTSPPPGPSRAPVGRTSSHRIRVAARMSAMFAEQRRAAASPSRGPHELPDRIDRGPERSCRTGREVGPFRSPGALDHLCPSPASRTLATSWRADQPPWPSGASCPGAMSTATVPGYGPGRSLHPRAPCRPVINQMIEGTPARAPARHGGPGTWRQTLPGPARPQPPQFASRTIIATRSSPDRVLIGLFAIEGVAGL